MSISRGQAACWLHVSQVLDDRRPFNQNFAVVQHQYRHVAVGIDGKEILPISGFVRASLDFDDVDIEVELPSDDMRRQGAGRLMDIKLHHFSDPHPPNRSRLDFYAESHIIWVASSFLCDVE
jgi:hypothetical protein